MCSHRVKTGLSCFVMVLWLWQPELLWSSTYETQSLGIPAGIEYGWTFTPNEPSFMGEVFLIGPNPRKTADTLSGVWYMGSDNLIRSLVTSPGKIEAFPVDLNGDRYQDIVVQFLSFPNDSSPSFTAYIGRSPVAEPVTVSGRLPLGTAWEMGAGDLNGDGLAEILARNQASLDLSFITISWAMKNLISGDISYSHHDTLLFKHSRAPEGLVTGDYLFGDYNGDTVADFVFLGCLFLGRGEGGFEPIELSGFANPLDRLLGAGDFDGNGTTELLIARTGDSQHTTDELIVAGYVPGSGFDKKLSLQSNLADVHTFDYTEVTGDGYPDLVLYNGYALSVIRGRAGGRLSQESPDTLFAGLHGEKLLGATDWGHDGLLDWMFLDPGRSITVKILQAPLFKDRTAEAGLEMEMAGYAAAVADFNNDSYPDVFVLNGSSDNALFAGNGDGTFSEVAQQAGVALANDGISCAWGDYDNDGFVDLFIAGFRLSDKLYHNNGDGTFSDSSRVLNHAHPSQRATSACWGDINNDGWLDLLIGNYDGPNWLLCNQAGRSFQLHQNASLEAENKTESAVIVDVDLDGRLDIVTLNSEGPTRLILNTVSGFIDRTDYSGLNPDEEYKKFGQTQTWGDFNTDGYPDLYITRAQDVDMMFLNSGRAGPTRFRTVFTGHHDGRYGRIASAIADFDANGASDLLIARSSCFGDLIGSSGDLLFLGDPATEFPVFENSLLGSEVSDVTSSRNSLGLARYQDSSLPVAADFDLDGDLDLLYINYLPDNPLVLFQGSSLPVIYMQNQSQVTGNLLVSLRRTSNQSLVGTRVVLTLGGKNYTQVVSGGSGRIQTGTDLLFSFGAAGATAESLKVFWPDGKWHTYPGPILPGTLEVIDDTRAPVITTISTPEELSPPGVDIFYATVRVEDDSPIEWVLASLATVEYIETSWGSTATVIGTCDSPDDSATIHCVETSAPGIYRVGLPAPAPGDSLMYFFIARDIFGNTGCLPETPGRFGSSLFKLKVYASQSKGDINQDGKTDILDLVRLIAIINATGEPPGEEEFDAADLDGNGNIDIFDLLGLINILQSGRALSAGDELPVLTPTKDR